jgi:hypothetical protein
VHLVHDYTPVARKYAHLAHIPCIPGTTRNANSTRPAIGNLYFQWGGLVTVVTRPLHRRLHVYALSSQTPYYLSKIKKSLFPPSPTPTRTAQTMIFENAPVRHRAAPGTVKNNYLLDSRQASRISWQALHLPTNTPHPPPFAPPPRPTS